jgi:hypothetical protein
MVSITEHKRKRKKPEYKSFKLAKKIKPPVQKKLSSVFSLLWQTCKHIWFYKKIFVVIFLIHLFLIIIFVQKLNFGLDINDLKSQINELYQLGGFNLDLLIFAEVVAGSGEVSELSSTYQSFFMLIMGLAYLWLFRQSTGTAKKNILIRQPFYEGMTPLIPIMLVLMAIGLQLLPMTLGVTVFSVVQQNGLAVTIIESVIWGLLALLLTLLTFYWLSSSIFALIIVTLPKMTPIKALKSAKKVVAFRRWLLMRKLFLLTIIISAFNAGLTLLAIIALPQLAQTVWLATSTLSLPISIGAIYRLYRELL